MRQRNLALLAAVILLVGLVLVAGFVPVPYAVLLPGPACNTVGRPTDECRSAYADSLIKVTPASYAHTKTDLLYLTTIGEETEVSLFQAVQAYLSSGDAVIPRAVLIPDGESSQQVNKQDVAEMTQSQSSAAVAAMTYLGLDQAKVVSVSAGGPSSRLLRKGDVIVSVDGRRAGNAQQLVDLVQSHRPGQRLALVVTRNGARRSVTVTAGRDPHASGKAYLGIAIADAFAHGIKVSVGLQDIGGPSAGLMLTLGIIDTFEPHSLTGGRVVAGTGTINDLGQVGPIGGIPQKMYAARHNAHASVFLAPAGDCADVAGAIPAGLQVVKVTSLHQALDDLAALRSGDTDLPGC